MHGPEPNEELRLNYRYLDLRRPAMQEVFILRHRMAQLMRTVDVGHGLPRGRDARSWAGARPKARATSSSPAGVHAGHFYALPQSPQLYKQLLMVSGFDRYFQIARCFRDEDLRANRQPEFTQLDVEMSFVEDQDVTRPMEILVAAMAQEFTGEEVQLPLPRLDYHDVMERFGNDRPDLRYGLELKDVADIAARDRVQGLPAGQGARPPDPGLCAPGGGTRYSRKDLDGLTEFIGGIRRQGTGLAQGRGRGLDRPDRQVLPARGPAASSASGSRPSPAT